MLTRVRRTSFLGDGFTMMTTRTPPRSSSRSETSTAKQRSSWFPDVGQGVVPEVITDATKRRRGPAIEEVLQHADELAVRFESYEADPNEELDPRRLLRCALR